MPLASKKEMPSTSGNRDSMSKPESKLTEMFEFFSRIIRLKILRVNDTDAKFKYSAWLNALQNHSDAKIKYNYVKLLLMGLDRAEPVCPFNKYPTAEIEPIETNWVEKARNIFQRTNPECKPIVLNPPVATAVSEDKCRFAAYQTIPNVGLQCYYAQSDEPLHRWSFKLNSPLQAPEKAVQAGSLDWERSLAGIKKIIKPIISKTNLTTNDKSSKLNLKTVTFNKKFNPCKILETIQENRVKKDGQFKWFDNSLLTGETIAGSDLCIDWSIREHEKTQLEIDEEIVKSFDKLYPNDFRLHANPEFLEGIIKKMDCTKENAELMDKVCAKIETEMLLPKQCAKHDISRTNQLENPTTEHNLLTPNQYENLITKVSHLRSGSTTNGNDDTKSPGFAEKRLKDISGLQSNGEHSKFNAVDKDTNVLPSFSEAIKSFNFIADKAEVTMREVNDWLKSKERFSTEFDASERIENHTRSNKTDYSYFPDSIDK